MEIAYGNNLYQNVIEPTPLSGELAVEPIVYIVVKPNGNSGFFYESGTKGIKKIINYLRVYRFVDIYRKVVSRSISEKIRNDKYLVFGICKDDNKQFFIFFHPGAQLYQNKLIVSKFWVKLLPDQNFTANGWLRLKEPNNDCTYFNLLSNIPPNISGHFEQVDDHVFDVLFEIIKKFKSNLKNPREYFNLQKIKYIGNSNYQLGKPSVLFGFGNYARTIVLPYLKPYVFLKKVHEIDSSLLLHASAVEKTTNPFPDTDDFLFPVWLIAGYHNSHASLAIEALNGGATPVIEKPIATTLSDFQNLKETILNTSKPFYQCFQKRYQIFNDFIFNDLDVSKGDPINFKSIVFEIPLPKQHWYNWPVSGSRIVSNGCHWIDYFLYLNNYSDWCEYDVKILSLEELLISIKLKNGAIGVITISDVGSNRLGMREYIEISTHGKRAVIVDSMYYESENNLGKIRSARTDKLASLRNMYKSIGKDINAGGKGDSLVSLNSTKLSLLLEEIYKSKINSVISN